LQKKRGDDRKRERTKTEVPCPAQTRDYCKTFHLIDKRNGAEANYNLGGKSRLHNRSQKLIFWFYNMALNNAPTKCTRRLLNSTLQSGGFWTWAMS